MKINADDCIESSAHCSCDNNANNTQSQAAKMNSGEPVKVIFTLPSETGCEGTKYRPLRIMPVSVNSLVGQHYSWEFIQKQFRSQNQMKDNKSLKLFGKFTSNGTIFPLNNAETYETALKVAELREDSFDILIQPSFCEYSSESENEIMDVKSKPLWTPVNLPPSNEAKISNSGNDEKLEELKPLWVEEIKEEIKKEVTSSILTTVISALQDLKHKTEENVAIDPMPAPEKKDEKIDECAKDKTAEAVVHNNIICDYCEKEIRGIRYKCCQCADFDLCEVCERITDAHFENHIFQKIKKPLQKKVYGGEDIILSLDVDLPTGRTEVKDIRFVSKQKKPAFKCNMNDTSSDPDSCQINTPKPAMVDLSTKDQSVRPKHIERKVAELNKKVEKLRVKGQSLQKQLLQTNDGYQEAKNSRYSNSKLLFLGGTLLSEETTAEGNRIQPGSKFKKVWKVKNSGTKSWNSRTTVRFCWGNSELEPLNKVKEFPVPPLKPGQEGRITIRFTIAKSCSYGFYHSHWRLHHRGQPFGQRLVCKVFLDPSDDKCQKGCNCTKCGYESKVKQKIVGFKEQGANLEAALTAVREIKFCDNCEEIPIKTNVKSHTTTPTNTPFDISPPKSPEPSSLIEEPDEPLQASSENCNASSEIPVSLVHEEGLNKANGNECFLENESLSAFSYSSSESSDEFVIVPLPRCFDLTTPFSCVNGTNPSCNSKIDMRLTLSDDVDTEEKIPLVAETSPTDPLNYGAISVKGEATSPTVNDEISEVSESKIAVEDLLQLSGCCAATVKQPTAPEVPKCGNENMTAANLENANDNIEKKPEQSVDRSPENKDFIHRSSTNPFLASLMSQPQPQSAENMIHVLPESIVNGALNVAANVVQNVSRALFSAQSLGSNENYNWVTSPPPAVIPTAHQFFDGRTDSGSAQLPNSATTSAPVENPASKTSQSRLAKAMSQLFEMGFWNKQLNEELLEKHNFDVNNAVEDLLSPDRQNIEVVLTQPRQAVAHGYTEFD